VRKEEMSEDQDEAQGIAKVAEKTGMVEIARMNEKA
jgi:hypothetical protein